MGAFYCLMEKKDFTFLEYAAEAVVVGAGHAGCEAALALARTGIKTALLTLNLDRPAVLAVPVLINWLR